MCTQPTMEALRLVDTHTHLHCEHFNTDREQVLERAMAAGVHRLIEVGYDLPSSRAALDLADRYPQVFAVVGLQPNQAHRAPPDWLTQIRAFAAHPKVIGIGEIGLDYYRNAAPHDLQQRVFIEQLDLARALGLPVVIHSREAHHDTVDILQKHARDVRGMLHSFSGDWDYAKRCLDLGWFLSFSGPLTFPRATTLHEVARRVPIDRMLVETDSPYLTPHPFRGERNEPAHVMFIVRQLASLRQMPIAALADALWNNAERLFFP